MSYRIEVDATTVDEAMLSILEVARPAAKAAVEAAANKSVDVGCAIATTATKGILIAALPAGHVAAPLVNYAVDGVADASAGLIKTKITPHADKSVDVSADATIKCSSSLGERIAKLFR